MTQSQNYATIAAIINAIGIRTLARCVGVSPGTVINWRDRGLPPAKGIKLAARRRHAERMIAAAIGMSVVDIGSIRRMAAHEDAIRAERKGRDLA